jgi:hypothetical protein
MTDMKNDMNRGRKAPSPDRKKKRMVRTIGILYPESPANGGEDRRSRDGLLKYLETGNYRYYVADGTSSIPVYNISLEDVLSIAGRFNHGSVAYVDLTGSAKISFRYYGAETPGGRLKPRREEQEVADAAGGTDPYTLVSGRLKLGTRFLEDLKGYDGDLAECGGICDVDSIVEDLLDPGRTGYGKYCRRGNLRFYVELTKELKKDKEQV